MGGGMRGVVAAGHPVSAETGAQVLREGGNAVDAALAAVLASFVTEPLLTGLGAGGYLLVAGAGREPVVLDFFVATPGGARGCELIPANVSFGDAEQVFNVGAASCGVWGTPAGIAAAAERFASVPLADLAAPAAALAREGVAVTGYQAYVLELLLPIVCSSPEARAHFMPDGRPLAAGHVHRDPALADSLEVLGAQGAEPFYTGSIGRAAREYVGERGGAITAGDLADYEARWREPIRAVYHGREVLTNPPPAAGGLLVAFVLALLERGTDLVTAMERAQEERTPAFMESLGDEAFAARFIASRLGSTTHVSVIDADGLACAVTCTNGEGSGIIVPGTGMHVNNMMGEYDLNPLGFFTHPPGLRLPSMMAPTIVLRDGAVELVVGSAGSNRIRSAIVQVIRNAVDAGMDPRDAVEAPRLHFEDGVVYTEPGVDESPFAGRTFAPFRGPNMFFGGVQAAARDAATGALSGAGDPRRAGAVVVLGE